MYFQIIRRLVLLAVVLSAGTSLVVAQSPTGVWQTIDDENGEPKSHVEIYQQNGAYYGKVVKLLQKPQDSKCEKCTGARKNQPVVGMVVMWDMTPYRYYWSNGRVFDPEKDKNYNCSIWFEGKDYNTLYVRGYLGPFYRTQRWIRVK
jgi:uncharacterized protein (DUF2147 family)